MLLGADRSRTNERSKSIRSQDTSSLQRHDIAYRSWFISFLTPRVVDETVTAPGQIRDLAHDPALVTATTERTVDSVLEAGV